MDGIDVMQRPVKPPGCGHWRPVMESAGPRILHSLLSFHLNQQVSVNDLAGSGRDGIAAGGGGGDAGAGKAGLGVGVPTPPASQPGSPVPPAWLAATPLTAPASPASRDSPAPSWLEYPYRDRCNSDCSSSSSSSSRRGSAQQQQQQEDEAGCGYPQHYHTLSSQHQHRQQELVNDRSTISQIQPMNLKKRPWSHSTAEDQPMDLSCPKKAKLTEFTNSPCEQNCAVDSHSNSPRIVSCNESRGDERHSFVGDWGANRLCRNGVQCLPDPCLPEVPPCYGGSQNIDNHSILKSILCGGTGPQGCYIRKESDPSSDHTSWYPHRDTLSDSTGLTRSPYARVQQMINKAKESAFAAAQPKPPPVDPTNIKMDTAVTLAKKNLFPVRARVSDWLLKIVQFAKSVPEFMSLPHNDKVTLTLNAWARLLLIFMADTNFQFAVTPCRVPHEGCGMTEAPDGGNQTSANTTQQPPQPPKEPPTMRTVEAIQSFIRKFQTLNLDSQEVIYMKLITLFHPGFYGMENAEYVETVNTYVRQSLQEHISSSRPKSDTLRYSQLLLCLPSLFGISPAVLEALFCKHITSNTDMEVLLKEMLQKL